MSDLEQALDIYQVDVETEITSAAVAQSGGEVADRFVVDDESKAVWALRKLRSIRQSKAHSVAVAEQELARIQRWLNEEQERLGKQEQFFESLLVEYHRLLLRDDERAKTVRLPGGTLEARKRPDQWNFDEDTFIKWAADNYPELLRVKTEIDKKAAKDALAPAQLDATGQSFAVKADTGEVAVGVVVEAGGVRYSVKVTE